MLWKASRKESADPAETGPAAPAALPSVSLSRFFGRVARLQPAPHVLMLGELCGENVTYLGKRGFRVCIETDVRPETEGPFAGALIWDAFSRIPWKEATRRAALLHDLVVAGGAVLAMFAAPGAAAARPLSRFRILSENSIRHEEVEGRLGLVHPYQNRDIIRLFGRFNLEHMQTRRDGQREALFFKALKEESAS